jgi:hypothetical protein
MIIKIWKKNLRINQRKKRQKTCDHIYNIVDSTINTIVPITTYCKISDVRKDGPMAGLTYVRTYVMLSVRVVILYIM